MFRHYLWIFVRRQKLVSLFFGVCISFSVWLVFNLHNVLDSSCKFPRCSKSLLRRANMDYYDSLDEFMMDNINVEDRLEVHNDSLIVADPRKSVDESMLLPDPIKNLSKVAHPDVCTLPYFDPFDASIQHLIKDVGNNPQCDGPAAALTIVNGSLTWVPGLQKTVNRETVRYRAIERAEDDDDAVAYGKDIYPFRDPASVASKSKITTDFIQINYKVVGSPRETHYIAKVAEKKPLVRRLKKLQKSSSSGLPLNIVIVGFDSTSNANFRRKLPMSYKILLEEMKAYEFKGYTIVGDATTPALTALLTGKFSSENPSAKRGESEDTVDDWPWIMRQLRSRGYVTLYAEDDPRIASFNLRLNGFAKPPADHYMRPFWIAVEKHGLRRHHNVKKGDKVCFGSNTVHNLTLNYLLSLYEAYPKTPKFAFGFMSYLSHGAPDQLSLADRDLAKFLISFRKYQKNTILIIFGDHGSRIGPLRNTVQGSLEERLPWLSVVVPSWFKEKYPNFARNLKNNQDVVTTPFDVYATLQHILSYPALPKDIKTQSLFTKISKKRTCKQAGTDDHWCPCLKWKSVEKNEEVMIAAKAIVQKINRILGKKEITKTNCVKLKIANVIFAAILDVSNTALQYLLKPQHGSKTRYKIPSGNKYQLTVQTSPGGGIFEGTVTVKKDGSTLVNPHISRTNLYCDNAHCIELPSMRKYCLCHDRADRINNSTCGL